MGGQGQPPHVGRQGLRDLGREHLARQSRRVLALVVEDFMARQDFANGQGLVAKDANGGVVTLKYDREGEIVELRNERGQVHHFDYDVRRQLVGETTFSGAKRRIVRDGCGRVTRVEDGNANVTDFVYDALGRLIESAPEEGARTVYSYTAATGSQPAAVNVTS